MILILPIFVSTSSSALELTKRYTAHCCQSRTIGYRDYLDRSLDRTSKNMSLVAQVSTVSKLNQETYNLKDMMKQLDKDEFIKAMEKEVISFFKEIFGRYYQKLK